MTAKRFFLFLQGCTCPFFHVLGRKLAQRGHRVGRVSFNVGDALMWRAGPCWPYRAGIEGWEAWLGALVAREGVTDLVMLGDTRPHHEAALVLARRLGLRAHVWEEGYFRPALLTVERGGINGFSRLPRDPVWYRAVADRLPAPTLAAPVPNPVWRLAAWELAYHLPNALNPLLYPGYRTHRPVISPVEFAGWAWRFARMPYFRRRDAARVRAMVVSRQRFFLFPLQLDGDGQITHHSAFGRIENAIKRVLSSFAAHAPANQWLVVKNHPLDTGLEGYGKLVRRVARAHGIEDRVLYLESGHLPALLKRCSGVVVVNSTVGTAALAVGRPLIALGRAIYDMPGLTFQGGLDAFWDAPAAPDAALFEAFYRVVVHATQVSGSFYRSEGCAQAAEGALRFMEPEASPLEALL